MTSIDQASADLLARHPQSGSLDERAQGRLRAVLAGTDWMDDAGLLDGDSCGYPIEGGYYDAKEELSHAAADPAAGQQALDRLVADWADDYVLTGRARLDRPWREYLAAEPS